MNASAEVAWTLADAVGPQLSDQDKTAIYVELGCRHYRRAILETLETVVRARVAISATMVETITDWLRAYPETTHVRRLHELLQMVIVAP